MVDRPAHRDDGPVLGGQRRRGVGRSLGGVNRLHAAPAQPAGQRQHLGGVAAQDRRDAQLEQVLGEPGAPREAAGRDRVEDPRRAGFPARPDGLAHGGGRVVVGRPDVDQHTAGDAGEGSGLVRVVDHRGGPAGGEQDVGRPGCDDDFRQALYERCVRAQGLEGPGEAIRRHVGG
jgi:hypothetical protein